MAAESPRDAASGGTRGISALLPSLAVMICVGAAVALRLWPPAAALLPRPAMITALAGLTLLAVGVALVWSMGLRNESAVVRLIILVPIVLSVALTVALMLDTHFRGPGLAGHG